MQVISTTLGSALLLTRCRCCPGLTLPHTHSIGADVILISDLDTDTSTPHTQTQSLHRHEEGPPAVNDLSSNREGIVCWGAWGVAMVGAQPHLGYYRPSTTAPATTGRDFL